MWPRSLHKETLESKKQYNRGAALGQLAPLQRVACCATLTLVIRSFRHKGLQRFFETGSAAGIQPQHAKRLRVQLAAIDTAKVIDDIDLPGFRLHSLKGQQEGRWSISGNWRITFEFADGNASILDYEDYHS